MLGYEKDLYVLPFDHRSSFVKKIIGDVERLSKKDTKKIKEYKKIIFQAFLKARREIKNNLASKLAILIDDQFGLEIFKEAKKKKIPAILAVEESGQRVFTLRHGRNFGKNLLRLKPDFVKALLHYNPANKTLNIIQQRRLKNLNDYCKKNNFKLIVELLISPTEKDFEKAKGSRELFDKKFRTSLLLKSIRELRKIGIEPDIWKLEAAESVSDWKKIISLIKKGAKRKNVGIIVLGRGEDKERVINWVRIAKKVKGLNGFAIGRTVFIEPLLRYKNGKITKQEAIKEVADNYLWFVRFWRRR
jgi:5-dehydro-2-deoxygluconokinase